MAKIAEIIENFDALDTYTLPGGTYDKTKLGLGTLMHRNTGVSQSEKWIGPKPVVLGRPLEVPNTNTPNWVHVISWSSRYDWVFIGDASAAGATRAIQGWIYDKQLASLTLLGRIILTPPPTTNHTMRTLRASYTKHDVGTVSVSGTTVTGSGTSWQTDGACTGNRIGFGSTDPTQITTWYEISVISNDNTITLTGSAGTIAADTPYVIEDLRIFTAMTNATATNGGLFVAKGVRIENFATPSTTIPAATSADNIRAVYWLKDAATQTNTTAAGIFLEPATSKTSEFLWVVNGTTSVRLFKYNVRQSLAGTLTSGNSTAAFQFSSNAQTITGTASQANNGRYAVANHGPGAGEGCGYLSSTTRITRSLPLNTITAATNWIADAMTEVPPGGTTTFAITSVMNQIEYSDILDRFIIITSSAAGVRPGYLTRYQTLGEQYERVYGSNLAQFDQVSASPGTTPAPGNTVNSPLSMWVEGGLAYIVRNSGVSASAQLYVIPLGADWEYTNTTQQRVVFPAMNTAKASSFIRAFANRADVLGEGTGQNLGLQPEPARLIYRTTNIDVNATDGWQILADHFNMSSISVTEEIQLGLEFRTIGPLLVMPRVFSVGLIYNELTNDPHYQPSVGNSSIVEKRFAWRFSVAWGTTVPTLTIRLYDAVSNGLLLTDTTNTQANGTFEKSTNGGSTWGAYDTVDKANEITYIRYTPTTFADNIRVRSFISVG